MVRKIDVCLLSESMLLAGEDLVEKTSMCLGKRRWFRKKESTKQNTFVEKKRAFKTSLFSTQRAFGFCNLGLGVWNLEIKKIWHDSETGKVLSRWGTCALILEWPLFPCKWASLWVFPFLPHISLGQIHPCQLIQMRPPLHDHGCREWMIDWMNECRCSHQRVPALIAREQLARHHARLWIYKSRKIFMS